MAQDPSTNLPRTGAVEAPMDFNAPAAPKQLSDKPYTTMVNPYPAKSEAGLKWAAEHKNNFAEGGYDSEGYPIPSQAQIDSAYAGFSNPNAPAGSYAYNPTWGPAAPDNDNPYEYGSTQWDSWRNRNDMAKRNDAAKKAWQQSHAAQKKPEAAAAPAAPATPFASSGIDLTKEGKGESVADSINAYYNEHGIPTASNEAKVTLDKFRSSQPQDLSPYYDYASKLTSAKIDNAMSARGSYGSSNATGQIGAAEMALRADEAKANAQYGLDRYAQEGNLAGSSDASDARKNALEFSWAKGLSDIAFRNQDAGEGRTQQLFDDNFRVAAAKAGNWTDSTGKAIEGVGDATDAANNVLTGNANDQVSHANADANQANEDMGSFKDALNQGATNYGNFRTAEDAREAANKPKAN